MEKRLGEVIHFYDKINVAIVRLDEPLNVGDKIRFLRGGEELFDQVVGSMQLEHETIELAKPGMEVGIKVDEKVKVGAEVFRVD